MTTYKIINNDDNYLTLILVLNKSDLEEDRKITKAMINEYLTSNTFLESIEIIVWYFEISIEFLKIWKNK